MQTDPEGMEPIKDVTSAIPCQVCKEKDSIYRCPSCSCRTCSLKCCLSHKKEIECSGKRDPTAFVPLHQFSDSTLASDFHFLEDVLTKSDRGKRLIKDFGLSTGSVKPKGGGKRKRMENDGNEEEEMTLHPLSKLMLVADAKTPETTHRKTESDTAALEESVGNETKSQVDIRPLVHASQGTVNDKAKAKPLLPLVDPTLALYSKAKQRLVQMAGERKTRLLLMPPMMQRHKMNTSTKYDLKKNMIYWKVEFIFHGLSTNYETLNSSNVTAHPHPHPKASINTTTTNHTKAVVTLDRIPEDESLFTHLAKEFEKQLSHSAPTEIRSILTHFREAKTITELKKDALTLMKRIPCQSSHPKYHKLDLHQCLRDMLNGLAVIEFPTIEVVFKEDAKRFPLMIEELE